MQFIRLILSFTLSTSIVLANTPTKVNQEQLEEKVIHEFFSHRKDQKNQMSALNLKQLNQNIDAYIATIEDVSEHLQEENSSIRLMKRLDKADKQMEKILNKYNSPLKMKQLLKKVAKKGEIISEKAAQEYIQQLNSQDLRDQIKHEMVNEFRSFKSLAVYLKYLKKKLLNDSSNSIYQGVSVHEVIGTIVFILFALVVLGVPVYFAVTLLLVGTVTAMVGGVALVVVSLVVLVIEIFFLWYALPLDIQKTTKTQYQELL